MNSICVFDERDATVLKEVASKLNKLRSVESDYSELLCTLSLPQNRAAILEGRKEAIDILFKIIDQKKERYSRLTKGG